MRVLVVEDHARLATTLAALLRREGLAVDVAFDGADGLAHAREVDYDVVVLDRDLPRVHGDDVCRALVADGSVSRILMLTAAGTVDDRVDGLDLGADDYLTKPFDAPELLARVRALGRRVHPARPPVLVHGDIVLDPAHRSVTRAGTPVALSPKELAVLEMILGAGGAVVSAEEILEHVWDEFADPFSTVVKTTVSRLRAKLGAPGVIETVAQAGYRVAG